MHLASLVTHQVLEHHLQARGCWNQQFILLCHRQSDPTSPCGPSTKQPHLIALPAITELTPDKHCASILYEFPPPATVVMFLVAETKYPSPMVNGRKDRCGSACGGFSPELLAPRLTGSARGAGGHRRGEMVHGRQKVTGHARSDHSSLYPCVPSRLLRQIGPTAWIPAPHRESIPASCTSEKAPPVTARSLGGTSRHKP